MSEAGKQCTLLDGLNVKPPSTAKARRLIGRHVQYITDFDIDRSGRGYVFPRVGEVTGAYRRHIEIDGDPIHLKGIREMVDLGDEEEAQV